MYLYCISEYIKPITSGIAHRSPLYSPSAQTVYYRFHLEDFLFFNLISSVNRWVIPTAPWRACFCLEKSLRAYVVIFFFTKLREKKKLVNRTCSIYCHVHCSCRHHIVRCYRQHENPNRTEMRKQWEHFLFASKNVHKHCVTVFENSDRNTNPATFLEYLACTVSFSDYFCIDWRFRPLLAILLAVEVTTGVLVSSRLSCTARKIVALC